MGCTDGSKTEIRNTGVAVLLSLIVLSFSCAISLAQEERKIPFVGDEVSLVRIKASPGDYIGKTFVICGGVSIGDFYGFSYREAEKTHYSLRFFQASPDGTPSNNDCFLYLPRAFGKQIVEKLIEKEETSSESTLSLTRVTVTLSKDRYEDGNWDLLEVIDVQFPSEGWKDWEAGMVSGIVLPKKRIWKDKTGAHEISATFKQFYDGNVLLELEDGKTLSVKSESLSDEDIIYIAEQLEIQKLRG